MRTYDPLKALRSFLQAEAEQARQQLASIHVLAPGVHVAFVAVCGHGVYAVLCFADAAATFRRMPLENDRYAAPMFRRQIGHMTLRFKGDTNVWCALAFARQHLLLTDEAVWSEIPEPVTPYALDLGGVAAVRALLRSRGSAQPATRASTALAIAELGPGVYCVTIGHGTVASYEIYAESPQAYLNDRFDGDNDWFPQPHPKYGLVAYDLGGRFASGREVDDIARLAKERLSLRTGQWHQRPRYCDTFIVDELAP